MPKRMLEVYRAAEKEVEEGLKAANITPSCKRGCAHCCHMLTTTTNMEARALAKAALKLPQGWKEIALRCRDLSVWMERHNSRDQYFKARLACAFLDNDKKDCVVYSSRPSACRLYLVVSDPELCSADNPEANVSVVNLASVSVRLLDYCAKRPDFYLAPLALSVLFELTKMGLSGKDLAFVKELNEGLPTPEEWFTGGRYLEWAGKGLGPEATQAYLKAAQEMWGGDSLPFYSSVKEDVWIST